MAIPLLKRLNLWRKALVGPHFYFDLVRLARKGWSTLMRIAYLVVLLLGLSLMYRSLGDSVRFQRLEDFARYAQRYAYTLIVLQDVLVLLLIPVYVSSAIAEEIESGTIEPLFLSHLTDREIVLSKLGSRLVHVGVILLGSFPLLVFMHLWGNVSIQMLLYHEAHTFLLALSAGSICIWFSADSQSVFQAITRSFGAMFGLGLVDLILAYSLPWLGSGYRDGQAWYFASIFPFLIVHLALSYHFVLHAIKRITLLRREERKALAKVTGSFALTDTPRADPKRRRSKKESLIHPLALPIPDNAMFWKECLKDGSRFSLTWIWLLIPAIALPAVGGVFRLIGLALNAHELRRASSVPLSFTYNFYFMALAAYLLAVVFQTTMAVAGERERDTLDFLLLIPDERRSILWNKWIGPLWRNWPILAVSACGAIFGFLCGLYSVFTLLLLLLLPLPILLALSGVALLFSVLSRRVLYANLAMVTFLVGLLIAHIVASNYAFAIFPHYVAVIFETNLSDVVQYDGPRAFAAILVHQVSLLTLGVVAALLAFRRFQSKR
jgi:ABC-type transport system involved in multi-copper enzyme maturation permease subunit